MTLSAIAGDLKSNSDTCEPLSDRIVQLAEDFDFDGVLKLADKLDAIQLSGYVDCLTKYEN